MISDSGLLFWATLYVIHNVTH